MRLGPLLLALLVAGCIGTPATDAKHRLAGSFTEGATQADIEEAGALARTRGGEMIVLESFPAQFDVRGLTSAQACDDLRRELQSRTYVQRVEGCTTQA